MKTFRALCTAAVLSGVSSLAMADAASHAAEAERFLKLANADKLTTPVYAQVHELFGQHFAQAKAPGKQAVLESYVARANTALDKSIGWEQIKPEMVKLYTQNFTEDELEDLIKFYQSPLGKKMMTTLPQLSVQSSQIAQAKLEQAVPQVNKLLADMDKELGVKPPAAPQGTSPKK
ncbi:hypothetical protein IQ22_02566 [Pseudomonas duriflava]|uniref:DUF2059 domain-containing protein n=1 Tax=Pseudomonas duriflava TaxID=459528 RepID=A0A562Q9C3_9PSED|nr:DUF2059 domain-containing protein [Pseudomonas duriflava]TWI53352.1 hypothetical protein IQ22_02566 [Pseudomonas duriflava]